MLDLKLLKLMRSINCGRTAAAMHSTCALRHFALHQQLDLWIIPGMDPDFNHISLPKLNPVRRLWLPVLTTLLFTLISCMTTTPPPAPVEPVPVPAPQPPAPVVEEVLETQTGLASYYHPSLDGLETASGVIFDNEAMMAAHPTYPLGTMVRVTNLENAGAVVEVRITDRGPTAENVAEGVIIDLSGAAAAKLGMLEDGRVEVKVEVLDWGTNERSQVSHPQQRMQPG